MSTDTAWRYPTRSMWQRGTRDRVEDFDAFPRTLSVVGLDRGATDERAWRRSASRSRLNHLGGELPPGYLASRFAHSWPTTTRHLEVLEQARLVEVREGRGSHYRLSRDRALTALRELLKNLTPTGPEKTWKPTGPRHTQQL